MAALTTDRERTAHLLRRFGLGSTEAELDFYSANGWRKAVDLLLEPPHDSSYETNWADLVNPSNGNLNTVAVQYAWYGQLLLSYHPLIERLATFWHGHFALSGSKVNNGFIAADYLGTLRRHALSPFPELLKAVCKSPAMIFWLDNQTNVASSPNENLGREVLELFTLGEGNFSEEDVREAARALTGWSLQRNRGNSQQPISFLFRPGVHDDGPKTILGKTAAFDGESFLDHVAMQPQTARYLVDKILRWFVQPNPSPQLVEKYSALYLESGLDTKQILRTIMVSDEFYGQGSVRSVVKSPLDFAVAVPRQLGLAALANEQLKTSGEPRAVLAFGRPLAQASSAMGMSLLFPEDVSGWDGGLAWISSSTMTERIAWADTLFSPADGRGRTAVPVDWLEEKASRLDETLLTIYDADLTEENREAVAKVARASGDLRERVITSTRLVFGAPEFQFC
ncbi:MAG: DUF1800 domain-containing protein [Fimbriimonadaceae bacterium]